MRRSRFTEEWVVAIIRKADRDGVPARLCLQPNRWTEPGLRPGGGCKPGSVPG
jgi:hypothetical protein